MTDDGPQRLLYDSQFEHDACGVGFVADRHGKPGHALLERALEALTNLSHRGAIDADGKTGDGAGVLTQIPRRLFFREVERRGFHLRDVKELAVGVFFFPQDKKERVDCCEVVETALKRRGLQLYCWREVPTDARVLGAKAAATAPFIEQALIGRGRVAAEEYERTLYLVRKEIERRTAHVNSFYVASLSHRTIVYKGLLAAPQLRAFYKDLGDRDYRTALAVFHQRYSTNTFPNWALAQPFRMAAHNGEINTISGNRNWMRAREGELRSSLWQERVEQLRPVIWPAGSDSASFDNTLELLTKSGRDLVHAMMMMVPPSYETAYETAHENASDGGPAVRAFYDHSACLMEAWDGPAALAFSDGRVVGATLDRNGLRPLRYVITDAGLVVVASEAGVVRLAEETVIEKGRLGPGRMIAVDTAQGVILRDDELKNGVASRRPYADWVRRAMVVCPSLTEPVSCEADDEVGLTARMKSFGYTLEDVQRVLEPMFAEGKEAVGSMGDDTPLAVLSAKPRLLYHYFKQRFAQVTNPAIDPIRERAVMSLDTLIGARGNFLEEAESDARLIKFRSPVLTNSKLEWLRENRDEVFAAVTLPALFAAGAGEAGLEMALGALCDEAVRSVEGGCGILILSDRGVSESLAPIPMLLAVAAVHHRLIREGKRMRASLVAETGEAREEHHFACLIGYGASAVNPYLAFAVIAREVQRRGMSAAGALKNYKTAIENGLLKIMAKIGIATVSSYSGAQIFEALGVSDELIEQHFTGTPSRIGGVGLREIAGDALRFHAAAFAPQEANQLTQLEDVGYYRYRAGGEYHAVNPAVFRALHKLIKTGDAKQYEAFSRAVETRPPTALRDLLDFRPGCAVPVEEVEPAEAIVRRFSTSGMSLGALSAEAHETLAVAMNRLGAKSNSGEGGEAPRRYRVREDGDSASSRIKQVASARFGVTPEYLVNADELEIKISQGSKPGEGGQLPGHKVSAEIAAIRHSVPGVTLISPPPHHDIYSIEDLAQLIYDLRQVNPRARIAVKLVSGAGVGTIAAGVAKAHADVIHLSGHDGGTGASPLGSIKNAGSVWELGLAETQQTLVLNGLRPRVRLRVDGGLKTARDVVIAAMLGAEEFGFATAALVAVGCVMARQCHLNTCPVGIATQRPELREKFAGKPEMVMQYFLSLAEEVRETLARLGVRSLGEIVGRSDLLGERKGAEIPKGVKLDLRAFLHRPVAPKMSEAAGGLHVAPLGSDGTEPDSLNEHIRQQASRAVKTGRPISLSYEIRNTDRAVGARLAGHIAGLYGNAGLREGTIAVGFRGSAGQSFGAFCISGMRLTVTGEANDYVGKGMSGGEIVVRPAAEAGFDWSENALIGNTVLYGATGGALFVAGRAGERFAVRNSGADAVVEGVGDHGCEYMTAGTVVVLGAVGRNFAAGMTGGAAFVFDPDETFQKHCNQELVKLEALHEEGDVRLIRGLIQRHYELTDSARARAMLWDWKASRQQFWKVMTQGEQAIRSERRVKISRFNFEVGRRRVIAVAGRVAKQLRVWRV